MLELSTWGDLLANIQNALAMVLSVEGLVSALACFNLELVVQLVL
jgi:hypothetical protein